MVNRGPTCWHLAGGRSFSVVPEDTIVDESHFRQDMVQSLSREARTFEKFHLQTIANRRDVQSIVFADYSVKLLVCSYFGHRIKFSVYRPFELS